MQAKPYPINRGEGSKKHPFDGDRVDPKPFVDGADFIAAVIACAEAHGEAWVRMGSLEKMWIISEEHAGKLSPIPRVARQPRDLARFQATPKGSEWLANRNR
jgi:hypothetical protein